MKIIRIEIKSCGGCLNYNQCDNYPHEEIHYCMAATDGAGKVKEIDDITTIPKWCPLPNAPKEGK